MWIKTEFGLINLDAVSSIEYQPNVEPPTESRMVFAVVGKYENADDQMTQIPSGVFCVAVVDNETEAKKLIEIIFAHIDLGHKTMVINAGEK